MSGFVLGMGPCLCCGHLFSFNPRKVPSSSAVTGKSEPICQQCFDWINVKRQELGLEPFVLADGAYDPLPEEEL